MQELDTTVPRRSPKAFEEVVGRSLRGSGVPRGSVVVAAVSGGADSTALLLALARLSRSGACSVAACYVNHGLRGRPEIEAELASLRQLCARLGVPLELASAAPALHLLTLNGRRRSPEESARLARYEALGTVAIRLDAAGVATGHTASDQAETVLLRLLRGSGPLGLAAMRSESWPWGPAAPILLRPLLGLTRADTEAYCSNGGVEWSTDSSNESSQFLRNRVRRELLPALEALAPAAAPALARFAQQNAALVDWIDTETSASQTN